MLRMRLTRFAMIERAAFIGRGNNVPASPSTAYFVQCAELPGNGVRFTVRGGNGPDQTDMLRNRSKRA